MSTTSTLKSSGKYSLTETVSYDSDPALYAPGSIIPQTYMYEVWDNEIGELLYVTDNHEVNNGLKVGDNTRQMALNRATDYYNSLLSTSGQYDKPNLANTKISGGTTKETNPPKVTTKAVNSSSSAQKGGSSLPKSSQGVVANTVIAINNANPSHGCDVKVPLMMENVKTKLTNFIKTETNDLQNFATWLSTDVISPIVEAIKNAVKAIKDRIKQIQKYIDKIKKVVQDVQEFIKDVQELITFIMSLPAKLMQLIMSCMSALQNSLTNMVTSSITGTAAAAAANTSAGSATAPTP